MRSPNPSLLLVALGLALVGMGCTFRVVTPPAKVAFVGSPRTLPAGKGALSTELNLNTSKQLFGSDLATYSATYHRGIGKKRELLLTPSIGSINNRSGIYSFAVDLKQGLGATPHLAATYGTGYLYNEYAQAFSFQGGLLAGFENRYFVPTFSTMAFFSAPFRTREVCKEDDEGEKTQCVHPTTTTGGRIGLTGEAKLPWGLSILPSAALAAASSETHQDAFYQFALALRWQR